MIRRDFLRASLALTAARLVRGAETFDLAAIERPRVLKNAAEYLTAKPITVTASSSPRSTGGKHDFFSEGDYWWPDPKNPNGPYIQRDGMSNPDNFVEHRRAMVRLSLIVPALTAAYKLTRERKYSDAAAAHLRAWFIDPETKMNPDLEHAQAIQGRFTGRGTGIIDTLHLVEVARATWQLDLTAADLAGVKKWFAAYVDWMTKSKNGLDERNAKNNHGTCWATQVAAFSQLTGETRWTDYCRDRYKTVFIPNQEASDGSFPEELRRTKPYGYSLFNLDAMSILVQTLTTKEDNLWKWQLPDGRGMARAVAWMYPYIADKSKWPKPPDVMYFDQWPVRQPSLLFAGLALDRPEYLALWRKLDPDPKVEEVLRNWPVRQPVLWV
ncbi:MAG TPA: alginate lyase family protein [Candidatus Binataceae bacterium]|nr:alginate lyase family protein [Candidatus Binataceae bacterium]